MNRASGIPVLPRLVGRLLAPLPLPVLRAAAQRVVDSVARRHAGLFDRLGAQADKRFLIDATDTPFVFRLEPRREQPLVAAERRRAAAAFDARIAGPLAALLGMLHGVHDGDALFFSGDIVIEGDTEAVLALRNALDDAEIDLLAELAASLGPLGALVEPPARLLATLGGRLSGVPLTRGGGIQ